MFGGWVWGQKHLLIHAVLPHPTGLGLPPVLRCLPSYHTLASALPSLVLQLGTGDTLDRMVPTEVPLALDSEAGQLVRAMQVQCGAQHTLVLVQTRGASQVRSVGGNSYGELGLGDRLERHRFHPIPALLVSWGCGWSLVLGRVWE